MNVLVLIHTVDIVLKYCTIHIVIMKELAIVIVNKICTTCFVDSPPPFSPSPPLQTWFSLHCSGTGVWPPQQQKSVTPPGPFSPHEAEALQTDHLKQQGNWSSNASKSLNHTTYSSQAPGVCPSLSICTAFCLSIRLSVHPSICLFLSNCLSIHLSVCPSIWGHSVSC